MDRPTTGKRRERSGAVHVAELIERQPVADRAAVEVDAAQEKVAHRVPQSRAATMAKLAVLGMATVTLCGAVAAASMIARDRAANSQPGVRPGTQITGASALLPDELTRAVARPGIPDPRTGVASATLSGTRPPTLPAQRGTSQTGGPAGSAELDSGATKPQDSHLDRPKTSPRELVIEYYRLIESNPSLAYDLLSGDAFGTTLGAFLGSWASVRKIDVLHVEERADGVVAVVKMHLIGGSQLRITQLLRVTDTVPQRIVGAELLSAQAK